MNDNDRIAALAVEAKERIEEIYRTTSNELLRQRCRKAAQEIGIVAGLSKKWADEDRDKGENNG